MYRKKDYMPWIGERMRLRRKQRGLTQNELATLIKTKQHRISELERNRAEPGANAIIEIASVLDCSADFLLGLSDEVKVEKLSDFERDHIRRLRLSTDPNAVLSDSVHALINNRTGN